jgi:hypothetical protein
MNGAYINTKDYASIGDALNRWIDGSIIVQNPPNMVNTNMYLSEKNIYGKYNDIKLGRFEYGKNGGNLRFPRKILKIYPMQSVFLEDDPLYCPNYKCTWNQKINDENIYRYEFEAEANKQLRKLDYPYF